MKKFGHWLLVLGLLLLHTTIRAQGTYTLFFEKTYLHTDRSFYLPGENVWFKAYLVNPQTSQLTSTSKTLYVELLKPNDSLVTRRIVRLNNGAGNGDFELPGTLPAGTYKLRAYTRWMQNFADEFTYRTTIEIINGKPGTRISSTASVPSAMGTISSEAAGGNAFRVSLFPEGGSMVENVVSVVAVKAETQQGRSIPATGVVTNNAGDEVSRFTCDSTGMGLFTLLPLSGQTYKAKVTSAGQANVVIAGLPAALKIGAVLRVAKNDSLLQVQVTLAGLQPDTSAIIVGRFAGKVMFRQALNAASPVSSIRIPAAQLPAGINQLTVYHQKKPYAERLVYIRPVADTISPVNINGSKNRYAAKENVTLQLQADEDVNVSLAATDANAVDADNNMQSYLMLQSDIKGNIEHASRYFDRNNKQRYKQLDLLLLTQGWREYLWQRLASERIALSYLPEQGLQVRGSITDKGGKKPDGNYSVGLYAPKAPAGKKLYAATTDQNGRFVIDSVMQFGNFKVGLTPRNAAGKVAGNITIDSARYLPQTLTDGLIFNNAPTVTNSNQKFAETVTRRVKLSDTIKLNEVKVTSRSNIRLRDITVTSFGYKDEVLTPSAADKDQNLVQWLLVNSKQAKAADDGVAFWAEGKPWRPRIIANGYEEPLTDDTEDDVKSAIYNKYNTLRMSEIDKVVIKRMLAPPSLKQVSGASGTFVNMSGNVGGITKIGSEPVFIIYITLNATAFHHEGDAYEFILPGYYQAKKFYSPTTGGGVSDDGSLRTEATLHWQPNIMLKKGVPVNISFKNADFAGAVNVSVQGISKTGRPVSVNTRYTVQ